MKKKKMRKCKKKNKKEKKKKQICENKVHYNNTKDYTDKNNWIKTNKDNKSKFYRSLLQSYFQNCVFFALFAPFLFLTDILSISIRFVNKVQCNDKA